LELLTYYLLGGRKGFKGLEGFFRFWVGLDEDSKRPKGVGGFKGLVWLGWGYFFVLNYDLFDYFD